MFEVKQAADLQNDLQSVISWGKKWLVKFNAPKTKRLFFSHLKELFLPSFSTADANLHESNALRLLGPSFLPDIEWNHYTESIARHAASKFGSLCGVRQFSRL